MTTEVHADSRNWADLAPDVEVLQGRRAGFVSRAIAFVIDAVIVIGGVPVIMYGIAAVQGLLEFEPRAQPTIPDLSPREIEIIRFMAEGRSNKTIAGWLDMTEASVKVQIRKLIA